MGRDNLPIQQRHDAECALYRHFDAGGNLLYVGISISAARRLGEHQRSAWARQISLVTVEWLPSRADAERREMLAIREEKPKFNVVGAVTIYDENLAFSNDARKGMTPAEFRAARKSLGWTQEQAAAALGYGRPERISEIERGISPVTNTVAMLMRAYLDGWRPGEAGG